MSAETNTGNRNPSAEASGTPSGMSMREQMRGARYGEILLVTGHLNRIAATVYNTIGLNDCPAELWQTLDPAAIKREYEARGVILNGPRCFMMDQIGSADVEPEIHDFGGLQMRKLATVPMKPADLVGNRDHQPYEEQTIERTTIYVFDQGKPVFELVAPDGTRYVMQSYALIVDPTLTEADLYTLGSRLQLPSGWRYEVRTPDEDWTLQVNGEAHVIQDDLKNTYQRV